MRTQPTQAALLAGGLALIVAGGTPVLAETMTDTIALTGGNEVPPNDSPGTGELTVTFDTETMELTWTVQYSDLTSPPAAAHFHGPAEVDGTAPPVVPVEGSLESPFEGTATLTAEQWADLDAGRWYFNIHTEQYPDGELRGQVVFDDTD